VLIVAAISVITKEILFFLTRKVSKITQSPVLYANAWHHRSDSFSSLAVLVGGVAGLLGWGYADHAATIVVGVMITTRKIKRRLSRPVNTLIHVEPHVEEMHRGES